MRKAECEMRIPPSHRAAEQPEPGPNCPNRPNEIRRGNAGAALPVFPNYLPGSGCAATVLRGWWREA